MTTTGSDAARSHDDAEHDARVPHVPPRRAMAAGNVFVVGTICLVVGSFLNAPGILKTAKGQPLGWKRDVALFFAEPLADASHLLRVDRFRVGLQEILGRGGDDDINVVLPSPTTSTTAPPGVTTTLPSKPVFTPDAILRIWAGGDSLGDTPSRSLTSAFAGNPAVEFTSEVDTQISTGLARPEVFNWPAYLQDVVATQDPDALVVSLGSNDNEPLTGEGADGSPFLTDGWKAEYSRRVGGLMDAVARDGRVLFYLSIPIVRQTEKLEGYEYINRILAEQAALRPGRVYYVDTYDLLKGPDGEYADYLTAGSGELVRARADDGTHYTRFGGDRIAFAIAAAMSRAYDIVTDPAATTTTTTTTTTAKSQ